MKKKLVTLLAVAVIFTSGSVGVFATDSGSVANVTGFRAVSSNKAALLNWKPVSGADGYIISWQSADGKVKGSDRIKGGYRSWYTANIAGGNITKNFRYTIVACKGDDRSPNPAVCWGQAVRTMYYDFTFREQRRLISHTGGRVPVIFRPNTTWTATGFSYGRYQFFYKGRMYFVNRLSTKNPRVSFSNMRKAYSRVEATSFVNRLGLSSNTNKLVWVNAYTQKLYVFTGSKGNWKCVVGPWSISTGSVYTPTTTGLGRIKQKDSYNGGISWWSVVSCYSIHGKLGSWRLGTPASGGCVRNTNDHARWIFYNCGKGTSVYVW